MSDGSIFETIWCKLMLITQQL